SQRRLGTRFREREVPGEPIQDPRGPPVVPGECIKFGSKRSPDPRPVSLAPAISPVPRRIDDFPLNPRLAGSRSRRAGRLGALSARSTIGRLAVRAAGALLRGVGTVPDGRRLFPGPEQRQPQLVVLGLGVRVPRQVDLDAPEEPRRSRLAPAPAPQYRDEL